MISAFGVDHGEVSKAFSLPGMKAGVNAMSSLRQGFNHASTIKSAAGPGTKLNTPTKIGMSTRSATNAIKPATNAIKPHLKLLGAGAVGGAGGFAMGSRNKRS